MEQTSWGAVHNGWRTRFFFWWVSGQSHCGYRVTAIDVSLFLRSRDRHRAKHVARQVGVARMDPNPFVCQRVNPLYNGISIFKPYN